MNSKEIFLHADDYGLSPQTSAQILACCQSGLLDGISILPNFSCFEEDMKLLCDAQPAFSRTVTCSVHLNLIEGPCVADPAQIRDLVDDRGFLCSSWGKLFLVSFLPGRQKLQQQLETEISAQMKKIVEALPFQKGVYVDGHQHTQMIPVVFDALCAVIAREGYEMTYIRNSAEPLLPFLKHTELWNTYRPVNLVKNIILNLCAVYTADRMKELGCSPMRLWGLVMSGRMDRDRVKALMADMTACAQKQHRQLEILFHPGRMPESEVGREYSSADALKFYLSEDREVEKAALEQMKD